MSMNTKPGLVVQDAVPVRAVSAGWFQTTTVDPSWDQESAAKRTLVAFRTVLEKGPDIGQRLEMNHTLLNLLKKATSFLQQT